MPTKNWVIHIQGENLGPLPTDAVKVMLRQNRLQFTDFIWCKGNKKWHRIYEVDDFETLMPSYPDTAVPEEGGGAAVEPEESAPPAKPSLKPKPERAQGALDNYKEEPKKEEPKKEDFPKVRRATRVGIEAQLISKEHGAFIVVNVSEGGLYLKSDDLLPIGTDMKFTLQSTRLPKILDMTGVVIRHANSNDVHKGFAVEFTRVNPAYKRLLQEYVRSQKDE